MNNPINQIATYLEGRDASGFWIPAALDWIRRAMNGNSYLVTGVRNPRARVRQGRVVQFECDADAIAPDHQQKIRATIRYTFNGRTHRSEFIPFAIDRAADKP